MRMIIEFIPHEEQRYDTPGDYEIDHDGNHIIRISRMGNPDSEFAVALHEFVETYLCQRDGIAIEAIDAWDMNWEDRVDIDTYNEPGDHPDAPYHHQHLLALALEKRFIDGLGMDWDEHDKLVLSYSQ